MLLPYSFGEESLIKPKLSQPLSGPISLPFGLQPSGLDTSSIRAKKSKSKIMSIPYLETNLHKILARKFAEGNNASSSSLNSEELSFNKAKLLTKAYYRLLRSDSDAVLQYCQSSSDETNASFGTRHSTRGYSSLANIQSPDVVRSSHNNNIIRHKSSHPQSTTGCMVKQSERLKWKSLISASNEELSQIVSGLSNTGQALNEYLVDLLLEKDGLLNKQDEMLEKISELADELLE